jgi:hypothetical protein
LKLLTKPLAISIALCISAAESTSPVRMMESLTVRAMILDVGNAARMMACISPMSRPMESSSVAMRRPCLSMA